MKEILNLAKLMPQIIAVEGYPFSGKTTFIQQHFSKDIIVAEDHMLTEEKLPEFVTSDWSENYEDIIKRQSYFLDIEAFRCSKILSSDKKNKVMDRCIISVCVYLLARIEKHPQKKIILDTFYEKLQTYFENGRIFLPQKIIFMNIPFDKIVSRIGSNDRKCEQFFLNKHTFDKISKYYKDILSFYNGDIEYVFWDIENEKF